MTDDVPPMPLSTDILEDTDQQFNDDLPPPPPPDDDLAPPPPPPPTDNNENNPPNIPQSIITTTDIEMKEESITKPPTISETMDAIEEEEEGGGIINEDETGGIMDDDDNNNIINQQITHSQQINLDINAPIYLNILKMNLWNTDDVGNWLKHRYASWGYKYVNEFKKRNIDGKKLKSLNNKKKINDTLGDFIKNKIHLERIWREIQDSYREYGQLSEMLTATNDDGGMISSKFIRFSRPEIMMFIKNHEILKQKFNIIKFMEENLNYFDKGIKLIELNELKLKELNNRDKLLNISDIRLLLQILFEIKRDDLPSNQYTRQTVLYIWNSNCSLGNPQHKLLPQHLRDIPIIPKKMKNISGYNIKQKDYTIDNEREYFEHDQNIMNWSNQDCIEWLSRVQGKIDYKSRYEGIFSDVGIIGKDLIFMTPWAFENMCCITVKKHIRDMIKAIDVIRTHLIQNTTMKENKVIQFRKDNNIINYGNNNNHLSNRISNHVNNNSNTNDLSGFIVDDVVVDDYKRRNVVKKEIILNTNALDPKARNIPRDEPHCMVCQKGGNVMRCSNCKNAFYCSREHQVQDWDRHQNYCEAN